MIDAWAATHRESLGGPRINKEGGKLNMFRAKDRVDDRGARRFYEFLIAL